MISVFHLPCSEEGGAGRCFIPYRLSCLPRVSPTPQRNWPPAQRWWTWRCWIQRTTCLTLKIWRWRRRWRFPSPRHWARMATILCHVGWKRNGGRGMHSETPLFSCWFYAAQWESNCVVHLWVVLTVHFSLLFRSCHEQTFSFFFSFSLYNIYCNERKDHYALDKQLQSYISSDQFSKSVDYSWSALSNEWILSEIFSQFWGSLRIQSVTSQNMFFMGSLDTRKKLI